MIECFFRVCPLCKSTVKIKKTDGYVTDIEGGRWSRTFHGTGHSQRVIRCTSTTIKMSGIKRCYRGLLVKTFKPYNT